MHFVFDWWTLVSFSQSWRELEMSKHKVDSLWAARVDPPPLNGTKADSRPAAHCKQQRRGGVISSRRFANPTTAALGLPDAITCLAMAHGFKSSVMADGFKDGVWRAPT
jgi:hypothetical protein